MFRSKGSRALLIIAIMMVGISSAGRGDSPIQGEEGDIQLPEDYTYELIYSPLLSELGKIVRSENGQIYVQHSNESGGTRISLLDVDRNHLITVLNLPPWVSTSTIVGGPGDSFFLWVGGSIRQVIPDGSWSIWGRIGAHPWYYTPQGRMLGISGDETSVVELFPDGTVMELVSGLNLAYDIVVDEAGTIFIADFMAEKLLGFDPDGVPKTITSIIPDNTDLVLDGDGNLYLNNAAAGFNRVDKVTGALTPMTLERTPCTFVQSPADVVFDNKGRAIFSSWVDSRLSWADFGSNTGGELIHQDWANSFAVTLGPDDDLYVFVPGCGSVMPGKVVRFSVDGSSEVYLDGLRGDISDIALDSAGGLYLGWTAETTCGLDYYPPGRTSPRKIPVPLGYDVGSLTFDSPSGCLFVSVPQEPAPSLTILEFTSRGFQRSYTVAVPKAVRGCVLATDPEGILYAFGTEEERFMTGPEVDRWIMRLDLNTGRSRIISQINRIGCCPMGNFSIDSEGAIWWLLNPEFVLYKISPQGPAELFAYNLPVDPKAAYRNSKGDLFLNSPEGIYRIWQPKPEERVQLVMADLVELGTFGILDGNRVNTLHTQLENAVTSLNRGQSGAAENHLRTFLRSLTSYMREGILSEEYADNFILAIEDLLERL
jgi:hypothetical protein